MEKETILSPKRKQFLEDWYLHNFKYVKDVNLLYLFNFKDIEIKYLTLIHHIPSINIRLDIANKSKEMYLDNFINELCKKYHESRENIIYRIKSLQEIDEYNQKNPDFSRKR